MMKLSDKGYEKLNKHAYIQSEDPFMFAELDKDGVCEVELEPDDFKDFEKELSKFFFKLVEEQKPLPADMARLLNEHFWELG
jgi:glutamate/tyrosine decarboxylase-like PLP-dependent enzyme